MVPPWPGSGGRGRTEVCREVRRECSLNDVSQKAPSPVTPCGRTTEEKPRTGPSLPGIRSLGVRKIQANGHDDDSHAAGSYRVESDTPTTRFRRSVPEETHYFWLRIIPASQAPKCSPEHNGAGVCLSEALMPALVPRKPCPALP